MSVKFKLLRKTFFTLLHLTCIFVAAAFSGSCYMVNVQKQQPEEPQQAQVRLFSGFNAGKFCTAFIQVICPFN